MAPNLRKSLCTLALACALGAAHAQPTPSLEDAFWACDYIATTRGTGAAPESCEEIYAELKTVKFDGDFDELLAWWQANKAAAHERIAGMVVAMQPAAPQAGAAAPERVTRSARLLAATRAYLAEIAAALRSD